MNACVQKRLTQDGAAAEKDYQDDEKNVKYATKGDRKSLFRERMTAITKYHRVVKELFKPKDNHAVRTKG